MLNFFKNNNQNKNNNVELIVCDSITFNSCCKDRQKLSWERRANFKKTLIKYGSKEENIDRH